MMLIALLTLAVVDPGQSEPGSAWAEFSRKPALERLSTKVEVGTLGYDRDRRQLDFWLRRTIVENGRKIVAWADSRTCAQVRPALASMREIPVPKFAPIGSSKGPPLVLDGVKYSLETYSDEGKLAAETNVGTPLASWSETTLSDLDSCWTSSVPERSR